MNEDDCCTLAAADYRRIEKAIAYLEKHFQAQPSLHDLARAVGLSDFHFQRLFSRWVGISPKRFLQFLTKEYAKERLQHSENLLEVAYDAGLSGPSRLHDLFISCEAVTPGEFKTRGAGLRIHYGFGSGPFGDFLLAGTDRGLCGFVFVEPGGKAEAVKILTRDWQQAELREDPHFAGRFAAAIFAHPKKKRPMPLHLWLKGTNFQLKVWEALLRIPCGHVVSYQELAAHVGIPSAARAVANAVGMNPVPFLIPCHRVIRKEGSLGGYRYGTVRKRAILGWEAAHLQAEELA